MRLMDSGTYVQKFEKPWSTHKGPWASEIFFPGEENSDFFQVVAKRIF